jgi:hypothetical protein
MNLDYKNIVSQTLQLFPEYTKTDYYENNDKELAYSFFFGFTEYIVNRIKNVDDPLADGLVKKGFDLFNKMVESSDEKLSNLGVVEVLETLVQDQRSKEVALRLLRPEGQKWLEEVLKYTGAK